MNEPQTPFDWASANGYEKVRYTATLALEALGAFSKDKAQRYSAVFAKAKEMFPQLTADSTSVAENSFYTNLSETVKDEESRINCEGPWKGYYLLSEDVVSPSVTSSAPAVATPVAAPEERVRKEKERLLYPVATRWLQSQGYRCSDTSSGRRLGKWGNPDITGLLVTESVGVIDVEIATIEVKLHLEDWEYWIFEAVSHRRFSNRAYFAFAHPEELSLKLPSAMRYYSELYHVGIIGFMLSNQTFADLRDGKLNQPIDPNETFVQEIYSAPFMSVHAPAKKKFIEEGLGLHELRQVCTWGKPLEGAE